MDNYKKQHESGTDTTKENAEDSFNVFLAGREIRCKRDLLDFLCANDYRFVVSPKQALKIAAACEHQDTWSEVSFYDGGALKNHGISAETIKERLKAADTSLCFHLVLDSYGDVICVAKETQED